MNNAEYVLEQGISFGELRTRETPGGQTWEIYAHKTAADKAFPFLQETVILGYTKKRPSVVMGTKAILLWLDEEHHVELLNDAEREALRKFKEGWAGRVLWIQKHNFDSNNDYIRVGVEYTDGKPGSLSFKPFERGTRYKGLSYGIRYVPGILQI